MAKLTTEAIQEGLKKLQGWSLSGEAISKTYTWPSFPEAMKFVNQVADLAEQADHHPDILINYRRVTLTLSTHSEGGTTQKDLDLAARIERERM
ncbi:MAG: 4a-hydroxytetrahydrobiopterin dehydratase [Acidobacteria bacterium]|nr:4a-hydroxytetrahydrobiopterin dehydratase [Acidobacteriota bacterium]MCI0717833.1 4a-hydroxytetrahydrobiopterin dehydratase [Acidobacteriota bacterium]